MCPNLKFLVFFFCLSFSSQIRIDIKLVYITKSDLSGKSCEFIDNCTTKRTGMRQSKEKFYLLKGAHSQRIKLPAIRANSKCLPFYY